MTLQPPAVPVFTPGTPAAQMAALFNAGIRDPLTFLLNPPIARLRRTGALNITEGRHQLVPFDIADEDTYSGWTSPVAVGGGGSTTLNGATIVGATTAVLTSATNFGNGDIVKIDTGANAEYRAISISGTTITVPALDLAHSSGAAVVEVTSDPSSYIAPVPGWWDVTYTVSLSGTGAAGLAIAPAISVAGASQIGLSGGGGWEGTVPYPPTGGTTQFKAANGLSPVYANAGDTIALDLWFSTESAITAVDTTAGWECSMRLVWSGL